MGIVFSNVPPLRIKNGEYTISEYIEHNLCASDSVVIASGYASKKSILEIDRLIRNHKDVKIIHFPKNKYHKP